MLFGLNSDGILYLSGDGDFDLPKQDQIDRKLTVGFLLEPLSNTEASTSGFLG